VEVDGLTRSYLVHVPPGYDAGKATPVVLIFHGVSGTGAVMAGACGLNTKADSAGFVAVYPDGTGPDRTITYWSAGSRPAFVNDVKFVAKLLDDLGTAMNVDPKRVFATGMSNGGFMCYKLAAELSSRIAAIAPVAGSLAIENPSPGRPVPVMHFHGTADTMVPFDGPTEFARKDIKFRSVDDTVKTWARLDGCSEEPKTTLLPDTAGDGTSVIEKVYGPGKQGAEVVLIEIENGGHTWPGLQPPSDLLGKSTANISANDLMWDFFQKHPMQ
jgi:polyhydroxybutyrate depolymerase